MFSVKKYFVKMKIKKYFKQVECLPLASLTDYTKVELEPGKVVKYRVCREGGGGRGINCKTNTDGPSYWGSSDGDHFCIELVELFRQSFPQQHVR